MFAVNLFRRVLLTLIRMPPLPKGQPQYAARAQSMCQCCGQTQRQYLPAPLSATIAQVGTQSSNRGVAHKLCRLIWMILHNRIRYAAHPSAPGQAESAQHG
jgi:hypothetical protein